MRRGVFTIGAGVVLCAAAWGACGGEQVFVGKDRFQISFPESFQVTTWANATLGCYARTAGPQYVSMVVQVNDAKEDEGLKSLFTNGRERHYLEGNILTAVNIVRLNGVRAIKLEFEEPKPDRVLHARIYFAIAHGRSYFIRMAGERGEFANHVEEFDAIAASFKILTGK